MESNWRPYSRWVVHAWLIKGTCTSHCIAERAIEGAIEESTWPRATCSVCSVIRWAEATTSKRAVECIPAPSRLTFLSEIVNMTAIPLHVSLSVCIFLFTKLHSLLTTMLVLH